MPHLFFRRKNMKITLLGDSIRLIGYGTKVPELLGEGFEVYQPTDNCRYIKYTMRGIGREWKEEMQGSQLVHWNNGIWDTDTELLGDGEPLVPLDEYVSNVIKMLCIEHNVYAFPRLYADFMRLYNDRLGIVEVEAISATALTEEQQARIKKNLEKKLSKTVTVSNTVDESILGGLILRYDSIQLDGSVKTRLERIERGLKSAVI